eukprot:16233234-Heterocapsa_arctica.AAC.1
MKYLNRDAADNAPASAPAPAPAPTPAPAPAPAPALAPAPAPPQHEHYTEEPHRAINQAATFSRSQGNIINEGKGGSDDDP